jgi:AcrR family transcriptional regulator
VSAPARPTRKEQQARTREALLRSATTVMAEKGLQAASITEIAAHAGFTKGAFYANFASKDELLLAVLDATFSRALGDIEHAVHENPEVEGRAFEAGGAWLAQLAGEPGGGRLFLELMVHATRDEAFRAAYAERQRAMRQRIAAIYAGQAAELGLESPVPLARVAQMTQAMAAGVALASVIEPGGADDDLFGTMLVLFFTGLRSAAGE